MKAVVLDQRYKFYAEVVQEWCMSFVNHLPEKQKQTGFFLFGGLQWEYLSQ